MEYASKGVANAGLTTGIIGTALGVMNGGGGLLGGLLGNRSASGTGIGEMAQVAQAVADIAGINKCSDNMPVTRYELKMQQEIAAKDSEIALLKSEQNTEVKIADVYERVMTRVNADQREQAAWNAQQMVNNTQMTAQIVANATSIAGLQNCCNQITKLVVPNSAVCPGWGAVTVAPASTGTTIS